VPSATRSESTATSSAQISTPGQSPPPINNVNTRRGTGGVAGINTHTRRKSSISIGRQLSLHSSHSSGDGDVNEGAYERDEVLDTPLGEKTPRWAGGGGISAAGGGGVGLETPVASRMNSKLGSKKDGKRDKGGVTLTLRDQEKVRCISHFC
jgi:hypothetical protein